MNRVALVAVLGLAVCVAAQEPETPSEAEWAAEDDSCSLQWAEWLLQTGKVYDTTDEFVYRRGVFCANLQALTEAAAAHPEFAFQTALNAFADLTPAEFRAQRAMPPRKAVQHKASRYAAQEVRDIPAEFDWATASPAVVTPVRDQGSTGTCWAFSTSQNIEGQWALKHKIPAIELSVEQVVDCSNATDPANTNEDCGVFGGWPYLTYGWIKQVGGLQTEQKYPYCCGTGDCFPCDAPGTNFQNCGPPPPNCNTTQNQCGPFKDIAASISDWTAINSDEGQIATQLVARGPLSVLLDASWLQFYSSGILNPGAWCSKTDLDHAVLITGYGSQNGTDYWVVKNSWGTNWGMKGYFWIIRGVGECGINTAVTTAIV